jgi:hypothetical protein
MRKSIQNNFMYVFNLCIDLALQVNVKQKARKEYFKTVIAQQARIICNYKTPMKPVLLCNFVTCALTWFYK